MIPFAAVVLSFAFWCTVHLSVVVSLASQRPRWRAPLALVIPPLAPAFSYAAKRRKRAALWCAALIVYAIALFVASRS